MRLNAHHKQAIVKAVIADVPLKYPVEATIDQINLGLKNFLMTQMDARVAAVWSDPQIKDALNFGFSDGKNIVEYLGKGIYCHEIAGRRWLCEAPTFQHGTMRNLARTAPEAAKVRDLLDSLMKEQEGIEALKEKLAGALAPIQTRKKLIALFPEFEKYAPPDTEPSNDRSLPVLANVVTDLMKLGWPDGGKQPAAV